MTNTQTLQSVWSDIYQITHYKQPVFNALAEKRLASLLKKGDTVYRTYASDMYVESMGTDGSYNTQPQTDTQESLVIGGAKDTSFYEFEKDLEQAQLDVKQKYARKAMNKIFLQIDADVLLTAYQGAGSSFNNSNLGGSAVGIPVSVNNIDNVFTGAMTTLIMNNVVYNPNPILTADVKLEDMDAYPIAVISAQVYQQLILRVGGKTTVLGDKVAVSGHVGQYMGFQMFVSNALAGSAQLTIAATPTTGDTIVINGMTFTFVTSATNAGEITISGTSQTILKTALNAPFTSVSGYVAQTDNVANRNKLANLVCPTFANNVATLTQAGIGNMVVTSSFTSASNFWTTGLQLQHNIFGVTKSVYLVIQGAPRLFINPVSGKVGRDYVTWTYYGLKVFKDQQNMLIDVQIDASVTGFGQPTTVTN